MLDFATFRSAVKTKDQTDVYFVLAALFLKAGFSGVATAKEVEILLGLHLGTKTPKNVSACLRKNTIYVTPAQKGPPLKWKLTLKGLERLRVISGLALDVVSPAESFDYDVAFICALEFPEMSSLIMSLGGDKVIQEVGDTSHTHIYRQCTLRTDDGQDLRVILTTSTSMGLTAAAITTTQLVMQFRPRLVAMVGIAAGTRSGGKQFGDVLVADPSVDYASGKVVLVNGVRQFQPDPYPIGLNARLRSVLQKYRAVNPAFERIRSKWKGELPPQANRLHVGPLGAADQVIDDATRLMEIQLNWRKLIGVEMETYGVYRAVHESPEPKPRVVSFKSVCDFAAEKADSWQEYAAFVAAEFAVSFLKTEWSALWPKQKD